MSNIKFKRSSVPGKIPLTTDLDFGEIAVNYADGVIYYKNTLTQIQSVGSVQSTPLVITTTTASASTTTGALVVKGGVGVGGEVWAEQLRQTSSSVAIGANAGQTTQSVNAVSIGAGAGSNTQSQYAVAIGYLAGSTTQGQTGIAIGDRTGYVNQGANAVAIGGRAGQNTQGAGAIAIGQWSAFNTQSNYAISIGVNAGFNFQGAYAVAIGYQAGYDYQTTGSIIINATGVTLNAVNTGTFIAPIRADATTSATTWGVFYNSVTKELTTSTAATGGGGGVTSIIAGTNVTIDPVGGTGAVTINATGGGGGTPGGADTQVQFNNAGVFAGTSGLTYDLATNITSLGGTDPALNITGITEEHDVPAAGTLAIYAKSIAGRMLPKWVAPSGFDTPFQALIAQNKIAWWNPPGNATTVPGVIGMGTLTASGTATARNVATTNIFTRARRLGYNSAATAGQAGGHRDPTAQYTIGDAAGLGGFYYVCRFGSADAIATAIAFTGMSNLTNAPVVTTSPATFTNCIGIGCATGDTNYSIYYGGSAAQTPIALGVGFPAKTASTDLIELVLFAASNVNNAVGWRATNLNKYSSFTAAISGTALTSSAVTRGTISIGQTITGPGIAASTKITAGSGTAWTVSISQTVSATPVNGVTIETGILTAATAGTQLPLLSTFLAHRAYRSNNATASAVLIDIVSVYIEVDT